MTQGQRRSRYRQSINGRRAAYILLVAALASMVPMAALPSSPTSATVNAAVETEPMPHEKDAADDPAIWLDPTDPSRSTIIGTDKLGGLAVYDLNGKQLAYDEDSTPNNVDIRYDFPLGDELVDLVVTSDTTSDSLKVYRVDPDTRSLSDVAARTLETGIGVSGLCLYHSPASGEYYAFVSDSSGTVQQWELRDNGEGRVDSRKVRTISLDSTTEGCVADDRDAYVYIAEEDVGIWRYGAEPESGMERVSIDEVGPHLSADIEGLAIYNGGDRYLIASSQGSDDFAVYSLAGAYLGRFAIGDGDIDEVSHTDGIEVINADLGGDFASGLFIAQDDHNGDENQNFKLVPWENIAESFMPPLSVVTNGNDIRGTASPSPIATPLLGGSTTYYVDSRTGDDDHAGTSASAPWETLANVDTTQLQPGDRLLFRRGSSWTNTLHLRASGSSENPILVSAYGSGNLPTFSEGCLDVTGSYIAIQEIRTAECSFAGIALAGSNNRVERCQLTTSVAGIYIKAGARENHVFNNQIIDNNRMSVLDRTEENDSGAFGVLINGDGSEIAFNLISGSDAFSHDYGRDGAAIEIFGGQRNNIHHNVAADNDAFVELGDPRTDENTLAYNLVTSSLQTSTGIVTRGEQDSRGPVRRTRVENNTIVLTGSESQGFVCFGGCSAEILSMHNNIVQSPGKVGYADDPFDEDYNLFFGGQLQFTPGTHSIVTNPALAADSLEPAAGSPAIDHGVVLGYRHDLVGRPVPVDGDGDGEAAPDLGAYEFLPAMPAGAGSGRTGTSQADGDMGRFPDSLDSMEIIIPLLEGGSGFTTDGIQRHRDEGEQRASIRGLPGPCAAIEVRRSRLAIAKRSLYRAMRVPKDVKGGTNSGSAEHTLNLVRGPLKVVRRWPRSARSARRTTTPAHTGHPHQQSVRSRLRQPVDLGQGIGGNPCLLGLVRKHIGPISLSSSAMLRHPPSCKVATDCDDQTCKVWRNSRYAARPGARDVTQKTQYGVGGVHLGAKPGGDALSKGVHSCPKGHVADRLGLRLQPDESREGVDVVVLLAMLSVQQTRNVIDPGIDAYVGTTQRQTSRTRQQISQVTMHRGAHKLNVVIARHQIDWNSVAEPSAEGGKDGGMAGGDAVELCQRHSLSVLGRHTSCVRKPHPREVEDVAEKQEPMVTAGNRRALAHVIQPAGKSGVLGKWLHGIALPGGGVVAGSKVKIANNNDRRLARHHTSSTLVTVEYRKTSQPMVYNCLTNCQCG